jgi:hypothetical protein
MLRSSPPRRRALDSSDSFRPVGSLRFAHRLEQPCDFGRGAVHAVKVAPAVTMRRLMKSASAQHTTSDNSAVLRPQGR